MNSHMKAVFAKFDFAFKYIKVNPGLLFEHHIMGPSLQSFTSSFVEIGQLVPGIEIFKVIFYNIWALQSPWSCDQHHVNEVSFPCTLSSHKTYKIWLETA